MNLFAHGSDLHTDDTSQLEHLVTEPLFAIPLFVLVLVGVFYGLKTIGWSLSRIMLVELFLLFAVGVLTYSLIPALSIFSITIGILFALVVTLSQLSEG